MLDQEAKLPEEIPLCSRFLPGAPLERTIGAQREHGTVGTPRRRRTAEASAEPDQVDMKRVGFPRKECGYHARERLLWRFAPRGQANALQNAVDMDIHREDVPAERKEKNACRRLDPNSFHSTEMGERSVIRHAPQVAHVESPAELLQNAVYCARLLLGEPPAVDGSGDPPGGAFGSKVPAWEATPELSERTSAVCVACVLRENRRYQDIQWG